MERNEPESCPNCGCKIIVQGELRGNRIFAKDELLGLGSNLTADVCKDCGLVVRLWVDRPERLL
jgi:predicted RNA-binding Zn-ribbon protein involved in translation (DUF1610 family)